MKSNSVESDLLTRIDLDTAESSTLDGEQGGTEPLTREQRRSRRKRVVRSRTFSVRRASKRELERGRTNRKTPVVPRPASRKECQAMPRPCPFVSCRYHLYMDVSPTTGSIKLNFPDLEVWDLGESCALDVADREGATVEEVGTVMNLTRERIRQLEVNALAKIEALADTAHLRDFVDDATVSHPVETMTSPVEAPFDRAAGA